MKVFVIEEITIINMHDTVLQGYYIFKSEEAALSRFPDAIIARQYGNDAELDKAIDRDLSSGFGATYLLVEVEMQ